MLHRGIGTGIRYQDLEILKEEVEIDIYVPFYSNPGIPAEEIKKFTTKIEGFEVPEKEMLTLLKQKALLNRQDSVKGRKDLADLVSLFKSADFNWRKYDNLVKEFQLKKEAEDVALIIKKTVKIEEIDLNVHQMARLKKKILPEMEGGK